MGRALTIGFIVLYAYVATVCAETDGGEMILEESELGGAGFLITLPSKYQGELVEIN